MEQAGSTVSVKEWLALISAALLALGYLSKTLYELVVKHKQRRQDDTSSTRSRIEVVEVSRLSDIVRELANDAASMAGEQAVIHLREFITGQMSNLKDQLTDHERRLADHQRSSTAAAMDLARLLEKQVLINQQQAELAHQLVAKTETIHMDLLRRYGRD